VKCLLILFLLGTGGATGVWAQESEAVGDSLTSEEAATEDDGSWLSRNFKRYFGNKRQPGVDIDGSAIETVDLYAEHIGKEIAVVLVHQVERFDPYWDKDQGSSDKILHSVTKPFHSFTKDRLIREYLLFEQGQAVDPFLLADSERMLRQLDFINDVRIIIVPMAGEDGSVAVLVETRDKWPFGITGVVKDVQRYDLNLYFSNLGGYGVRLDNKMIYRGDLEPNLGYQGRLRKRNMRGTFTDLKLLYEDSWQLLSREVDIQRSLVHPGIRWVGGAHWEYTDVRDNAGVPKKYQLGDYWLGHAFSLGDESSTERSARPRLIPAIRYRKNSFKERPYASADTNAGFLDTKDFLVGVTYQRLKYYKTDYLFKMGETEDLPSGFTIKLSGGYQDREVYDRTSSFFQTSYLSVRNRGDVVLGLVDLGGYFHDHVMEDGALNVGGLYITQLFGQGRYRHRFYAVLTYTLAFQRAGNEALVLGNSTGLRGLEDNRVKGNQRVILKLESRLFTPWALWGFRFMTFGYADIGAVGGAEDPIARQKIYSSIGLGFRINNPDSVLPVTQLRFGFVNSIDQNGLVLGFNIGGADYPEIRIPGSLPGGFGLK
jgi:hypothetical protein